MELIADEEFKCDDLSLQEFLNERFVVSLTVKVQFWDLIFISTLEPQY